MCKMVGKSRLFFIGINDVQASARLHAEKKRMVMEATAAVDELIFQYTNGTLEKQAGCDEEQTLEVFSYCPWPLTYSN